MLEEGAAQLVRGGDEDGGSGEATTHGAAVGGGAPGAPGGGALRDPGGGFGAVTLVLDGGAPAAAAFADNDAVLVTVGESKVRHRKKEGVAACRALPLSPHPFPASFPPPQWLSFSHFPLL